MRLRNINLDNQIIWAKNPIILFIKNLHPYVVDAIQNDIPIVERIDGNGNVTGLYHMKVGLWSTKHRVGIRRHVGVFQGHDGRAQGQSSHLVRGQMTDFRVVDLEEVLGWRENDFFNLKK